MNKVLKFVYNGFNRRVIVTHETANWFQGFDISRGGYRTFTRTNVVGLEDVTHTPLAQEELAHFERMLVNV